mmetsp:Transcript_24945/g.59986  ORF Transcript_24945/g.59986 Transcript_24945/m.59986 type:complete len:867 (-) Transcript_24945:248-2848(-)|eukprot:CAMPEP_0114496198 /NCGR_PEP_ID=MMETSP0109-20121206/5637_1 /TAXON_ID=29199 /ORGANISM="Chlorarachnion reptans, Strain CCCM449" /LENGTH=866 /DNA_ID=CAMNT_0001673445 /DNA_START=188 /DNA_END=2788 /DNA_ORIENTATION=-
MAEDDLKDLFRNWYRRNCKLVEERYSGPGCANAINRRVNHPGTALFMSLLLVLDVLIVISAISVRMVSLEKSIGNCQSNCREHNSTSHCDFASHELDQVYEILSWTSMSILIVFGVETLLKLVANVRTFCFSIYNVLDFVIVWTSITLEFLVRDFGLGIIVIARTWRFVRDVVTAVVNGVSYGRADPKNDRILDSLKVVCEKKIGAGLFGQTFLATYKKQKVVVKVPHRGAADLQELVALINMKPHPNVISFFGLVTKSGKLCPVTKYYNLGSADKVGKTLDFREPALFYKIVLDISEGLAHLHDVLEVVHNDIRRANIFLEGDPRAGPPGIKAVIGDWGLVKQLPKDLGGSKYASGNSGDHLKELANNHNRPTNDQMNTGTKLFELTRRRNEESKGEPAPMFVINEMKEKKARSRNNGKQQSEEQGVSTAASRGSTNEVYREINSNLLYRGIGRKIVSPWPWTAPEAWILGLHGPKSDIYMVGVTLWELITGGDPYDWKNNHPDKVLHEVIIGFKMLPFPRDISLLIYSLIRVCLDPNPAGRPTAKKLCQWVVKLSGMKPSGGVLQSILDRQRAKLESKIRTRKTVKPAIAKLPISIQSMLHRAFVLDFNHYATKFKDEQMIRRIQLFLEKRAMAWQHLLGELPEEMNLAQHGDASDLEIARDFQIEAKRVFLSTYAKHHWDPYERRNVPGCGCEACEVWKVWLRNTAMFCIQHSGTGGADTPLFNRHNMQSVPPENPGIFTVVPTPLMSRQASDVCLMPFRPPVVADYDSKRPSLHRINVVECRRSRNSVESQGSIEPRIPSGESKLNVPSTQKRSERGSSDENDSRNSPSLSGVSIENTGYTAAEPAAEPTPYDTPEADKWSA